MKIKTITCHDVYNAGASLQAYAFLTYLENLGNDVEIIDYKPDYLNKHYSFKAINPAYDKPLIKQAYLIAKFPSRLKEKYSKRKANYDLFKEEYLKVTSIRYTSNEDLKSNLPKADIYFAGSDQIWNPLFQNGKDPAFYLDFVSNSCIKASYAASFAVDEIPSDLQKQTKKYLENLDFISIREHSGLRILEELGFKNCYEVCDPVFLLDRDEWEKLSFDFDNEKYLLVYDFDNNEKIKTFAQKIAYEKKLKIYSIFKLSYSNKSFENEGPLGVLSLLKNAEFVISNSFHATAFSIIFEKPFIVVDRNENINTRMKDLLKCFELSNINYEFDLTKLNENKDKYINKSKEYINKVINYKKGN